jgi:hypothetical protein
MNRSAEAPVHLGKNERDKRSTGNDEDNSEPCHLSTPSFG